MDQIIWTSREFNFDFPASMFPIIISRLNGAYPRIKEITLNILPQHLTVKLNHTYSIQQQIGHLIDLEELHFQRLKDFENKKIVLSAWDGKNIKTEQTNHNEKNIELLLREFKNVRNHFISELHKIKNEDLFITSLHPRLKVQMRFVDMAFFIAEHDDHHIANHLNKKK